MCASGILGSWLLYYIYVLLSLEPFIFDMPGIMSPVLGPSMDPGVEIGGITTPYHAHGFRNGHIPSSNSFVEAFYSLRSVFTLVVTLMGGGSGCVNVGSTPYFFSYVPSSTTLFPLNAVVMIDPPYILYFGFLIDYFGLFSTNMVVM